jgi:hypothetical protein
VFEKFKEFVNAPIKDGIRGTATVVASSMPPDGATSSNCQMRLTVNVPGQAPYNVKHQCIVKLSKWPWPGTTLPVTVDPAKPDHLRVEWDEVLTSQEELYQKYPVYGSEAGSAGAPLDPAKMGVVDLRGKPEVREQMFAALEAQGVDTSQMRAAVAARDGAPAAGGDPLVRLEKLGKLRDSGVLTADEFEAQKKRILDGS